MLFPPPQLQQPLVPGPPLHSVALSKLLDRPTVSPEGQDQLADILLLAIIERLQADGSRDRVSWPSHLDGTGYELFLLPPREYDQAALMATDLDGHFVGCVSVGGGLAVLPEHRGRGIGRELMIATFAAGVRKVDDTFGVSPGGLATLASAHREAVRRALDAGLEVPDEVMSEYPDEFTSRALGP